MIIDGLEIKPSDALLEMLALDMEYAAMKEAKCRDGQAV